MAPRATLRAALLLAGLALVPAGAGAESYTITAIKGPGAWQTVAYGINNAGQVATRADNVASIWTAAGGFQPLGAGLTNSAAINNAGQTVGFQDANTGFLWSPGAPLQTIAGATTPYYSPGGSISLNDFGQVVGTREFNGPGNGVNAFLWTAGSGFQNLGTPGTYSAAFGINASGTVVGESATGAFRWTSAAGMQSLAPDGSLGSRAMAINAAGQIVGDTLLDTVPLATIWSADGTPTFVTTEAMPGTHLTGINSAGLAVGFAEPIWDSPYAVFWDGSTLIDLNTLLPAGSDWTLLAATGINDSGQIVGWGTLNSDPSASIVSFVMTPIPEPATAALLGAGLLGLGLAKMISLLPLDVTSTGSKAGCW